MDGFGDAHLASPADFFFAGADDITKERKPGIDVIERTPLSLIITRKLHVRTKPRFHNEVQSNSKMANSTADKTKARQTNCTIVKLFRV